MTNTKAKTQNFANFSPPGKGFDPLAFRKRLDKGGRNYLQLDPYTVKGLQEVLAFSDIVGSDIVWTKELHVLYADILTLFQKKGRPGNWTISAGGGLHRLTGSVIRTLAYKLDIADGLVHPNTIEVQDFIDNDVANVGTPYVIGGPSFCQKIYESTFYYKKKASEPDPSETRLINASVSYFKKGGINGCEASYHLRGRSYATSVNKKGQLSDVHWVSWESSWGNLYQTLQWSKPHSGSNLTRRILLISTKWKQRTIKMN